MRAARFELVRTDADQPWHARFRAANGKIIATTENYARRKDALRAVELIAGSTVYYSPSQDWPEIWHGGDRGALVEIRDVDERP